MSSRNLNTLPVNNKRSVWVTDEDQNVYEIVDSIKRNHDQERDVYDTFSKNFWKGNVKETGKSLFSFLKDRVKYDIEPESDQTVKTPGRLLQDGRGDCKHYASFIVGVCDSLNRHGLPIKARYRFVSDMPGREIHHVFAVIEEPGGKQYWVDPVIGRFDQRPKFFNTKDVQMISKLSGFDTKNNLDKVPYNMGIVAGLQILSPTGVRQFLRNYQVSPQHFQGLDHLQNFLIIKAHENPRLLFSLLRPEAINGYYDDEAIGNFFDDLGKGIKNAIHDVGKGVTNTVNTATTGINKFIKHQETNVKNAGKEIQKFAKGQETNLKNAGKDIEHVANEVKDVALKVALSAGRGPYLALVSMNAFNLGKRLWDTVKAGKNYRDPLLRKWNDIGGSPTALINAINSGARKYFGSKWDTANKVSGRMGAVQIAALVALAAGILAIIEKFIHSSTPKTNDSSTTDAQIPQPNVEMAIKDGVAQLAVSSANAQGNNTLPGFNDSYVNMGYGVQPDGTPTMEVRSAYYPGLEQAGAPPPGYSDIDVPGGGANYRPETGGSFDGMIRHALDFASSHKLLTFGAGAVLGGALTSSFVPGKKNKKYVLLGALAAGGGTVLFVNSRQRN